MRPEPIHILILLVLVIVVAVIILGIVIAVVLVRRRARQRGVTQSSAVSTSSADELTKLANLHHHGVLTDEEFAEQKRRLLE